MEATSICVGAFKGIDGLPVTPDRDCRGNIAAAPRCGSDEAGQSGGAQDSDGSHDDNDETKDHPTLLCLRSLSFSHDGDQAAVRHRTACP
jgi:hypothetical protein